jgi:hypothetical protein
MHHPENQPTTTRFEYHGLIVAGAWDPFAGRAGRATVLAVPVSTALAPPLFPDWPRENHE